MANDGWYDDDISDNDIICGDDEDLFGDLFGDDDDFGIVWVPQVSTFFHTKEAIKKRQSIIDKSRMRDKPKFPGGRAGMYREIPDPYGPGMTEEETPEYKRWRAKVYMPWRRKRRKVTRWWKKSPQRKRWRAESRTRFQRWRRRKIKGKLKEARTKKRKGLFKKARKKSNVWWQKQRLKLIPKSSKRVTTRLRRERQERHATRAQRRADRGAAYSPQRSGRRRSYGAVDFDNDDGTWLVFGALGLLGGVGFFF